MPVLHVMRHAKSDRSAPVADHDRPLAARGRDAAPRVGRHLAASYPIPDAVHVSTARRAVETVELALGAFDSPPPVHEHVALYLADAASLCAHLAAVDDRVSSLLLVGHNPGLAQLVVDLAGEAARGRVGKLPTGTLVTCEVAAWHDVDARGARLLEVVTPRELA